MKVEQLFDDYGVDYRTEGHKHCRPGWVNRECPFCTGEHSGLHLGYNTFNNYFMCWRCGWHNTTKTIAVLINVRYDEAKVIIKQYGGKSQKGDMPVTAKVGGKEQILPSHVEPMMTMHRNYLLSRNFNPEQLEKDWNLMGTGKRSMLDNINFKYRIVYPIIWDNRQVSFQTRSISDKSGAKYITCPKEREVVEHKHILYGKQSAWEATGICVEGVTDVWRIGFQAFATFGIKWTTYQAKEMKKHFKRVAVLFDDEPQAQKQAIKLVNDLIFRGVDAWNVKIKGDPGSMKQKEANKLVKSILNKK